MMVNGIELLTVDLVAHNGILHIIDMSVSPPSEDLVVGNRTVCANLVPISACILSNRVILSVFCKQMGSLL